MIFDQTDTALVLVRSDATIDALVERAWQTGAARVQFLVFEGVALLRDSAELGRLRTLTEAAGIEVVLISADPATLEAARQCGVTILPVHDAEVAPPISGTPATEPTPAITRVLEVSQTPVAAPLAAAATPTPLPAAPDELDTASLEVPSVAAAADDIRAAEDSLAAALEVTPPPVPPVSSSAEDDLRAAEAGLAAALAAPPPSLQTLSDSELLAAALDQTAGRTASLAAHRKIVLPANLTLPPEEAAAATPMHRPTPPAGTSQPVAAPPPATQTTLKLPPALTPRHNPRLTPPATPARAATNPPAPAPRHPSPTRPPAAGSSGAEPHTAAVSRPPRPARRGPLVALILGLLLLLLLIGGLILWGSRVTVSVSPPVRSEEVEVISALPVPIVAPPSTGSSAVAAEPLSTEARVNLNGQISEGTLTPAGTASGEITILNAASQAVPLPAGTEFIAITPDGREVPFTSSADVLVPGATTSDTGAQIVTSRGQANVTVNARSPGSGSNVDANAIRRISVPGGGSFNVTSGGFLVQHPPLGGGSEEEVRIVKESDVQALLPAALESLDAEARRQLEALAGARSLTLDSSTLMPSRSELEQLRGFETTVQPPIGETVDPLNPTFSVNLVAQYRALATPADQPLSSQLGPAMTEQLRQAGKLNPGDCRAPVVVAWRWDGTSLLVDGEIRTDTSSPGCDGSLTQATLEEIRTAVRGKSRSEAQAALDDMVLRQVIGAYQLPDGAQMPSWDWQIMVVEAPLL